MTPVPTFSAGQIIAILENIGDWIFVGAVIIAPIVVIIGAFMLLTGGDNPQRLARARTLFIWATIGFILALLSRGIFGAIRSIFGG